MFYDCQKINRSLSYTLIIMFCWLLCSRAKKVRLVNSSRNFWYFHRGIARRTHVLHWILGLHSNDYIVERDTL
jgi:hypothetical protein